MLFFHLIWKGKERVKKLRLSLAEFKAYTENTARDQIMQLEVKINNCISPSGLRLF